MEDFLRRKAEKLRSEGKNPDDSGVIVLDSDVVAAGLAHPLDYYLHHLFGPDIRIRGREPAAEAKAEVQAEFLQGDWDGWNRRGDGGQLEPPMQGFIDPGAAPASLTERRGDSRVAGSDGDIADAADAAALEFLERSGAGDEERGLSAVEDHETDKTFTAHGYLDWHKAGAYGSAAEMWERALHDSERTVSSGGSGEEEAPSSGGSSPGGSSLTQAVDVQVAKKLLKREYAPANWLRSAPRRGADAMFFERCWFLAQSANEVMAGAYMVRNTEQVCGPGMNMLNVGTRNNS